MIFDRHLDSKGCEMFATERLLLRRPTAEDLAAWQAYFHSDRATALGGGPATGSGLSWRVFATFMGHWELCGCGPFVMERKSNGRSIGLVGPWYPSNWPERELTWSIWEAGLEGQGYAFEAATAVRSHVFDDLGWPTAVSYIARGNARSIALAQRLGCQRDDSAPTPDEDDVLVYRHQPRA